MTNKLFSHGPKISYSIRDVYLLKDILNKIVFKYSRSCVSRLICLIRFNIVL